MYYIQVYSSICIILYIAVTERTLRAVERVTEADLSRRKQAGAADPRPVGIHLLTDGWRYYER